MQSEVPLYRLNINPEPWAIGPVGVNRKAGLRPFVGQNQQLKAYQEAVKEEFEQNYGLIEMFPEGTKIRLDVWFWRKIYDYGSPQARRVRKHEADLTNLLKAFEDALQGVFYKNDKDVMGGEHILVDQGDHLSDGLIIFRCYPSSSVTWVPSEVMFKWAEEGEKTDNSWPPAE